MADIAEGSLSQNRSQSLQPWPSIQQTGDYSNITVQGSYNDVGRDQYNTYISGEFCLAISGISHGVVLQLLDRPSSKALSVLQEGVPWCVYFYPRYFLVEFLDLCFFFFRANM